MYECNANSKRCALGPKCLITATFQEAERKMHEVLAKVTLQDIVDHSAKEADWIGAAHASGGNGAAVVNAAAKS
jgi:DNA-binding IscR family transcriptional regulator